MSKFEYDFHKDVRVDISPKSLILTAFDQPVNYQQPFSRILDRRFCVHTEFVSEKFKILQELTLKSGRKLSPYITQSIYKREYNKTFKKMYFSARKKIIGKNPEQDKCNALCARWGRLFKKETLKDVTTYGLDLQFLLAEPHRCSIAENAEKKANILINEIESINYDFLKQTKYLINPPVLQMLSRVPNIPANLSKSHVQLLACAEYYKNEELFNEILNMSNDAFLKLRKKINICYNQKFDFRKYKDIRNFYHCYSNTIKIKSHRKEFKNETEIEEGSKFTPTSPIPAAPASSKQILSGWSANIVYHS